MSWVQLRAILDDNRATMREERQNPSPACPIDGALLEYSPLRRAWNCPMGNYQTTGGPRQ